MSGSTTEGEDRKTSESRRDESEADMIEKDGVDQNGDIPNNAETSQWEWDSMIHYGNGNGNGNVCRQFANLIFPGY